MVRWAAAALALWILVGAAGFWLHRGECALHWSTTTVDVPVVVIESDDWGGRFVVTVSDPPLRNLESAEAAAVERLVGVLRRHQDSVGRHPIISAFVVVGQPDIAAIAADSAERYHWIPIDHVQPCLVATLRRAQAEGFFEINYHARDHCNADLAVQVVREAITRAADEARLFDPLCVSTFHPIGTLPYKKLEDRNRLTTEYLAVRGKHFVPPDPAAVDSRVAEGVCEFRRLFERPPRSTVAAGYMWGPDAEASWRHHGIRFVHGVNYQRGVPQPTEMIERRGFGFRTVGGMVGVTRNVVFEPDLRMCGPLPSVDEALASAARLFAQGQPAVVCAHAWCFYVTETGLKDPAAVETMFSRLDDLLTGFERTYPNLRYASSEEVGQLAEAGRVDYFGGRPGPEIVAARGLKHAWFVAVRLAHHHPKVKLWALGLAGLTLALAGTSVAGVLSRRDRPR
ncbi:MAG: hypothetical protein FJ288_13765 [Planctomycetes bacterium]|nr:hypothetical protein [Planctomycetota bacterium]